MPKILIVDDSKTQRTLLRELLENSGFSVVGEAENGEEGLMKFKELRPDLVTLDITMPKINGIECLSLIKHEDKDAKVVMITSENQKSIMVDALKKGAEDFIIKPYDPGRVIETLKEVLDTEFS